MTTGEELGTVNVSPAAVARLRARAAAGTAVQPVNVVALCDELERERARTKAIAGFANVGLSYARERHPPHVGMFSGPCPQCMMMVDAERVLDGSDIGT